MAEGEEVVHDRSHAGGAIERHGVGARDARVVDDKVRRAMNDQFGDPGGDLGFVEQPDEDDRINAHGQEVTDHPPAFARVQHLDEGRVVLCAQQALQRGEFPHGRRGEQVLHADPDGGGVFALQVKGVRVGREAGGLHRRVHAGNRLGLEPGLAVEHPRNGGARQTDMAGKIGRGAQSGAGRGFGFAHGGEITAAEKRTEEVNASRP